MVASHKWYLPGPVLGPVLLEIVIDELDKVVNCTFNKFTNNAKLGTSVDVLKEGSAEGSG